MSGVNYWAKATYWKSLRLNGKGTEGPERFLDEASQIKENLGNIDNRGATRSDETLDQPGKFKGTLSRGFLRFGVKKVLKCKLNAFFPYTECS